MLMDHSWFRKVFNGWFMVKLMICPEGMIVVSNWLKDEPLTVEA